MSKLNLAVISDLHLGNSKNKTTDIIANLKLAFPDNAETAELDIIFLAGDIFDRLLTLPNDDVKEIGFWITHLLNLCAKHDILLRVLEGTPSHDWKQSEQFVNIAKIINSPIDLVYVKELSIEYIQKYDIHVLYIPDEWQSTTERTLADVKALLKAKGLTHVDYAIMHGAFTFQLPEIVKSHKHDPDEYLAIVRELIFIGHIHTFSTYKRIIAQGSFDRLAHGEEEPKGHVRATITNDGYTARLVENKKAKIFKSIDCTDLTVDESLQKIDNTILNTTPPNGSYIRVIGSGDKPVITNMNVLVSRYPLLIWSRLVKDKVVEDKITEEGSDVDYIPITITPENLKGLLMNRVFHSDVDSNVVLIAEKILNDISP